MLQESHYRHGHTVETDTPVPTTWDEESVQKAIEHFQPFFKETQPLAVYARVGEETEVEGEDLLVQNPQPLDTLHIVAIFDGTRPGFDKRTTSLKMNRKGMEWFDFGKDGQYIEALPITLPSSTSISTLPEILDDLHITLDTHKKIYHLPKPEETT